MRTKGATRRLACILGIGLFSPVILFAPTPASACAPLPNSAHCYGVSQWFPTVGSVDGVKVQDQPSCFNLDVGNTYGFVTSEMWLGSSDSQYWVEVGFISNQNAVPNIRNGASAFWADKRPGDTALNVHQIVANPSYSRTDLYIYRDLTANEFAVLFGSYPAGYSSNNTMSSGYAVSGSETTTSSTGQRSLSSIIGMSYLDSTGWHAKWSPPYPGTRVNAPQTFSWSTIGSAEWAGVPC
jgi:hypothetical protein